MSDYRLAQIAVMSLKSKHRFPPAEVCFHGVYAVNKSTSFSTTWLLVLAINLDLQLSGRGISA